MNQVQPTDALQQEIHQLRQENQALRHKLLQSNMDRAIRDEQLSRHCAAHMEDFFPEPLAPLFLCILFHGGKASDLPDVSPLESVTTAFSPVLENFGTPFFFETAGTVVCLLNTALPEDQIPLCQPLLDALSACFPEPAASVSVSHISVSHASPMHDGPSEDRAFAPLLANLCEASTYQEMQVGFSNRWVFMRVFKQLAGCTPGSYRTAANL